ncbi:2-methylfumaryl-CoA isomerase [Novosphingobium sp. CF614]|uniref:CoA transferase n=1 Tax=Novosphingobium sp. CF614 TaxID=1884364 RepID=UPI0008E5A595|nr:CoA transferase [Novosphingobium sp. CF614]SFG22101.1 2-methylfumaryl-CoA isomerase [Novosphingobium sp. CF614]
MVYHLLQGMRIVEGAAFIAGPSCGLHLAQMGAEVIRFDNIGGGPDFRRWPLSETGHSLYWEGLNKGKKSVAIDMSSPEGRELAMALATAPGPDGGMFVTNFPVDGFLSYPALSARRPDLICLRVMGWADGTSAVDYTINAAVGVPMMTGPADDPRPVNHVLPAWDLLTGAYAAFALLAAERARRTTGQGQEIRVPLSDIAATTLSHLGQVAEVLATGTDRPRMGNDLFGAFGRDFETRDGRIIVIAITPRQWRDLVELLGLQAPTAAIEAELGLSFAADEGARFTHRRRLFPLFEAAFARLDTAALKPLFDARGVCWSAYRSLSEAVAGPGGLFRDNPVFQEAEHPSGLRYPAAGPAATFPGLARGTVLPAPRLGENTDEVLAGLLGLGDLEIARLHDKGVIAGARSGA